MNLAFIGPVLAQVGLTFLVFFILFVRRIPAMAAAKPTDEQLQDKANLQKLPAPARFAAENFNHQFEMPVLFYALCLVGAIIGLGDDVAVAMAWAYVALRCVHAFIHCTYNKVMHRFGVFALSSLVLMAMFGRMAMHYWGA